MPTQEVSGALKNAINAGGGIPQGSLTEWVRLVDDIRADGLRILTRRVSDQAAAQAVAVYVLTLVAPDQPHSVIAKRASEILRSATETNFVGDVTSTAVEGSRRLLEKIGWITAV